MATADTTRTHVARRTEQRQCATHGAYTATLWEMDPAPTPRHGRPLPSYLAPFWSRCPTCDAAMQREADVRDAEIAGGVTERDRLARARRASLGIPARFVDSTVEGWLAPLDAQRRVLDTVRTWLDRFDVALKDGRCLVFCGPSGTGKTRLAAAALRRVSDRGGTGRYVTAFELVAEVRDSYRRDADRTERQVVDAFVAVDLLVVDEVGRQLETAHEREQFFRVIDARYRELRPTLLVTNLSKGEFAAFVGDAIVDRLREGGGQVLAFDWASHRSTRRAAP